MLLLLVMILLSGDARMCPAAEDGKGRVRSIVSQKKCVFAMGNASVSASECASTNSRGGSVTLFILPSNEFCAEFCDDESVCVCFCVCAGADAVCVSVSRESDEDVSSCVPFCSDLKTLSVHTADEYAGGAILFPDDECTVRRGSLNGEYSCGSETVSGEGEATS